MKKLALLLTLLAAPAFADDPCKIIPLTDQAIRLSNQNPLNLVLPGGDPQHMKLCTYPTLDAVKAARNLLDTSPTEKYRRYGSFNVLEKGVDIRVYPDSKEAEDLLLDLKTHADQLDGSHWATEKEHKAETSPYIAAQRIAKAHGFNRVFVVPPAKNGRDTTLVEVCKIECQDE